MAGIEVTDHEVLNTVNNISLLKNVMGMSYCLNVLNVYVLIPLIIKINHHIMKILNIHTTRHCLAGGHYFHIYNYLNYY